MNKHLLFCKYTQKKQFSRSNGAFLTKNALFFFGILPTLAVLLLSFPLTGRLGEKKKSECVCEFFFQYNDGCIPVRRSGSEWAGVEDSCIEPWGAVSPPQGLKGAKMLQPLQGCGLLLWLFRGGVAPSAAA
ncbi:MAG: hypothetical protein SPM02_06940 [Bacteroidales bacterium]|nr:hypothetical protein [Bacteroidales bacterium]